MVVLRVSLGVQAAVLCQEALAVEVRCLEALVAAVLACLCLAVVGVRECLCLVAQVAVVAVRLCLLQKS